LFNTGLLAYTFCYVPTIAILNSLSFHQMDNHGKEFPSIRVLDTIEWIVGTFTFISGGMELHDKKSISYLSMVATILSLFFFVLIIR